MKNTKTSLADIGRIREEYAKKSLRKTEVNQDPLKQFEDWFSQALETESRVPNAMTLSTTSKEGKPNGRVLLLKGFSEEGFTFYTNYDSQKGIELAENPNGHLLFFWDELQRQIRIEGLIEKVSRQESEEYFESRPRGSQIGAIASPQSFEIENRVVLEEKMSMVETQMEGIKNLPCPENWGGYILIPSRFEFWQGRINRLHDRIVYEKKGSDWKILRIAP